MSELWDSLEECKNQIIDIFSKNCKETNEPGLTEFNNPESGWINRVWESTSIRRAHIDVVDARETKKLWMMHVCLFPHVDNDAPIYGFDVISGPNKMTGAFLDLSPTLDNNHDLCSEYQDIVKEFVPNKQRDLPQWAKNIFSSSMVAAGNVKSIDEAKQIIQLSLLVLQNYMNTVDMYNGVANPIEVAEAQNYYCENQQQNPHTAKVMKSLGLDEERVDVFCRDMLFPKIK